MRSHAAALAVEEWYWLHQYLAHVHVVFWVCSSDARVGMSRGQFTTSRCVCLCCHVVSEPHLGQVGHVGWGAWTLVEIERRAIVEIASWWLLGGGL